MLGKCIGNMALIKPPKPAARQRQLSAKPKPREVGPNVILEQMQEWFFVFLNLKR